MNGILRNVLSIIPRFHLNSVLKKLKRVYRKKIGHDLNLENPVTYTEKMQWSKLYDNSPLKGELTDKYAVREWVKEKVGDQYLIPLLGVYNFVNEINFDTLPNQFVLKTNNGSATNIIVHDKKKLNKHLTRKRLKFWLNTPFSLVSWFEMHYDYIKPKIIVEQLMHDTQTDDLRDYKFLCFDSVPHYVWVDFNRRSTHSRKIYDMNWNLQKWNQYNYPEKNIEVKKTWYL